MKSAQEFERVFRLEFQTITNNLIWQNDEGVYEVFDRYRIYPQKSGYLVECYSTEVGLFSSTRSALSWCIADKNQAYNAAREILETDVKLSALNHDIATRAAIGDRTKNSELRETVLVKLERKIIHKKRLENQLTKCVNWAKYIQQRGFDNEAQRTGRNQPNKASR